MTEIVPVTPEPTAARIDLVRFTLQEIASRMTHDHVEMGCLLYEASENEYFRDWGYESMADYAMRELDFKRRKAEYLRNIYGKFVVELGIDKQEVLDLKWTKAALIAPLLDEGNSKEWLKKAKDMPYDQLARVVKQTRVEAGKEDPGLQATSSDPEPEAGPDMTGGFEGNMESRRFMLYPKQRRNVDKAFEKAQGTAQSEKPGHLLDMICMEFLAGRGEVADDPQEIHTWVSNIKKRFPDVEVIAFKGSLEQRRTHLKMMLEELESTE